MDRDGEMSSGESLASSAVEKPDDINAAVIAVLSESGQTARSLPSSDRSPS
jgi:hypothetical protein